MRCAKCNYSLFDIRERICPECGGPIVISKHIFDHCGVRFCCPHCDQQYYGTDPNGHLVPRQFNCICCHNHISMNEMIVRKPLHTVLHHRNASSFPGFAGVILMASAMLGFITSALVVIDDSRFIPGIARPTLQQLPPHCSHSWPIFASLRCFSLAVAGSTTVARTVAPSCLSGPSRNVQTCSSTSRSPCSIAPPSPPLPRSSSSVSW